MEEQADTSSPAQTAAKVGFSTVSNALLTHLGFYSVVPVLPTLLERIDSSLSPWTLGALLFAFNFSVRSASLFYSQLLHRLPLRLGASAGLILAAFGFALIQFAHEPFGLFACLLLTGAGISTNGLLSRVYVAMMLDTSDKRASVFGWIQIAVNVAAAVGPIAANLLLGSAPISALALLVGILYLLAAAIVGMTIPSGHSPARAGHAKPVQWRDLASVLHDHQLRTAFTTTAIGTFLYAQFFSAIVLHIASLTSSTLLRGAYFTANAILVILLQIPVSMFVSRRLREGESPMRFLRTGAFLFAVTFAVMAAIGASPIGTFAVVCLFSFAETVFSPMINTVFSELSTGRSLISAFNIRMVASALGDAVGAFCGAALFLLFSDAHNTYQYWALLAVLGTVGLALTRTAQAPHSRQTDQ
jgi:predicted MFS family arabinose efflux permease